MTDAGELHTGKRQFAIVPSALIHDQRISPGAVRCYAHMHWRYGQNHKNFEGRKSISEFLGVSERAISGYIKELEAHNWIVVVERNQRPVSGQFRTPFYHVFESRREGSQFRKSYKPKEDEKLRALPVLKEDEKRKSRKGKGGKPSHKQTNGYDYMNSSSYGRENSSSHGDQVNSSSHDHVNSGSHYPDTVKDYTDTEKEQQQAQPASAEIAHNQIQQTGALPTTPLASQPIPGAVALPLPPVSAPPPFPSGLTYDEPLPDQPGIYAFYVDNMRQQVTGVLKDKLVDAVKDFGEQWVQDAITEAVTHNVKTWAYVEACLDSWAKFGRDKPRTSSVKGAGLKTAPKQSAPTAPPSISLGAPTIRGK